MGSFADKRRAALLSGLSPGRALRICDVGASRLTEPPYQGLLDQNVAHLYGFEPNPDEFAKLAATKTDSETYFQTAIGTPGEATLYVHGIAGLTSLYQLDPDALRAIGKEKWQAKTLREIPVSPVALDSLQDLPEIDLLKMDLQGGELDVLRGGRAKLQNAVAVVSEVRFHRMYKDEPLFGDLDQELRAQGFKLHKFMFTKSVMMPHAHEDDVVRSRLTSQLLDGDAVYIRDGVPAEQLDNDQLAFLTMAADSIFDSPDLALAAIDALVGNGAAAPDLATRYIKCFRTHQKRSAAKAAEGV